MKRILTLLAIATFASCSIFAQDDMYFTPKSKAVKDKEKAEAKAAKEKELAEIRAAEEKRQAEEEARVLQLKKEWLRKNRQHISQTEDGKLSITQVVISATTNTTAVANLRQPTLSYPTPWVTTS